jgi:hypothetical protein
MSLICKLFGHKFGVRGIDVIRRLKESYVTIDNEKFRKAYELTLDASLDPGKEYYCKRCGYVNSGFEKFLGFYKFL